MNEKQTMNEIQTADLLHLPVHAYDWPRIQTPHVKPSRQKKDLDEVLRRYSLSEEFLLASNFPTGTVGHLLKSYVAQKQRAPHSLGLGSPRPPVSVTPLASPSILSVKVRFDLLEKAVTNVATGSIISVIISGPGGLGKTHTVLATLNKLGLEMGKDYKLITGYASPRGLYETLFNHNGQLIVFDDCDSVLNDRIGVGLLKGALDSYNVRSISWVVKLAPDKSRLPEELQIPDSFQFTGRVIFITNRLLYELDQPIRTRSLVISVDMNTKEKLKRMAQILPNLTEFKANERKIAFKFIKKISHKIRELNLRSLILTLKLMKANPGDWQSLAEYSITQ